MGWRGLAGALDRQHLQSLPTEFSTDDNICNPSPQSLAQTTISAKQKLRHSLILLLKHHLPNLVFLKKHIATVNNDAWMTYPICKTSILEHVSPTTTLKLSQSHLVDSFWIHQGHYSIPITSFLCIIFPMEVIYIEPHTCFLLQSTLKCFENALTTSLKIWVVTLFWTKSGNSWNIGPFSSGVLSVYLSWPYRTWRSVKISLGVSLGLSGAFEATKK